jgi:hypothetical protein
VSADEIVRVLHVAPLDVVTALVRHRGELAVTRFFARPVPRTLDAAVAAHVLGGGVGAALPPPLGARLAGFRVRAGLGPLPGVPEVVAAGVRRVKLRGLPPTAGAYGYACVTIRLHAGSLLPEVVDQLAIDTRHELLAGIVRIVAGLHRRGAAHGRLGAASFAVAGAVPTLVDLEPLRAGDAARDAHAADRAGVAALAGCLLGAAAPRGAQLEALWRDPPEVPAEATVAVADAPGEATVFVPDE